MTARIMAKGILHTDGSGLWSGTRKEIPVTVSVSRLLLISGKEYKKPHFYGQINAYFKKSIWNTKVDGLIYTDELFLSELRDLLRNHGFFNYDNVWYSEQGMQSTNYVNLDVGDEIALELVSKCYVFPEIVNR